MGNHKRRLERLEGGRKGRGIPTIFVNSGESIEEVWQKHLAQHPKDAKAEKRLIIKISTYHPPTPTAGTERERRGPGARSHQHNQVTGPGPAIFPVRPPAPPAIFVHGLEATPRDGSSPSGSGQARDRRRRSLKGPTGARGS